jgi:hypothetical protein
MCLLSVSCPPLLGARRLDDADLRAVLDEAGLRLDRYLTEDRGWLRAVPA